MNRSHSNPPPERLTALLIAVLALASLACSLTAPSGGQPTLDSAKAIEATVKARGQVQATEGDVPTDPPSAVQEAEMATATLAPSPTPTPTLPPALPVGLRSGLASLNSYRLSWRIVMDGPRPQDINHNLTQIAYSSDGDRLHTHTEIETSSADDPELESETSDVYQVGDLTCSLPADEDESPVEEDDPQASEMQDVLTGLADTVLSIDNPVLIGEENFNGVATRHYRFDVSGLGDQSGAEVTQSSGEYWVAVDGNYLVRYTLLLETRSAPSGDPDAKVLRTEVEYNLTDINQPVSIEMPVECN